MKFKLCCFVLVLVLGYATTALACTSFALYGNQVFYGMNFDYFAIPLKFYIASAPGMKIFHLSFLFEKTINDPKFKGYFADTCGMNTKGLFCASQEVEPRIQGLRIPLKGEVHLDDQYRHLATCANVNQVMQRLDHRQWIQFVGPSIHNLFADSHGRAMVTETDNHTNKITEIENNFMVMTNFPNHSLKGKPYTAAQGAGADRYMIAWDHLFKEGNTFTVAKAFELLKAAVLNEAPCTTLCSMVFSPGTNQIFIALDQDYERMWLVSLDEQTIETCQGYDHYAKIPLDQEGILAADLSLVGKYGSRDGLK